MTTLALIILPLADSDGWDMHGAGGWAPMMIGMLLFWGAIILGIVWLIRNGIDRRPKVNEQTAVEILDRRFAEGVISPDDYHERKSVLSGASGSQHGDDVAFHESERNQP